ncbi:peroxisomal bifunctional enzyme-like [Haliotis rufescens]|uniref:peroxisomal bifunctional enzyme-like n=1 Tax=Haliotis rufescens TaxID=6454 RepID=UPI00201ED505|nr:peroxisomal bifunctional enzyme-like [Haliotis rufescens]
MVDYKVVGSIAFLEVNNPPVNALSHSVRVGLVEGLDHSNKEKAVKAIVIIGKGSTFISGADIKEFGKPMQGPWLTAVGEHIEASEKPVIAGIHGNALGGGLEIALFSHYRIALKSARVGFPEVLIGILPGAAGTQRLPRVTTVPVAMEMIASGRHVSAPDALKYGILDRVVDKDLSSECMKLAYNIIGKPLHDRRLRNRPVTPVENLNAVYDAALAQATRRFKGFIAPVKCLQAVKAAVTAVNYEEGVNEESRLFTDLMRSGQARALQYAFFAERATARWQLPTGESYRTCKPLPIKTVGVIGAGTMGSGIAVTVLRAGLPVTLVEQDRKFLDRGVAMIKSVLEGSVRLKKLSPQGLQKCMSLLKATVNMDDLRDVDLVIEAVFESLSLKKQIFGRLDKLCKAETILCSNTSSLDINMIASATDRPDRVAGMHFFVPAYVMRLLENVYGKATSGTTVATIMQLGKKLGMVSVLVGTCNSFVANRTMQKYGTQATFLVEEGSLPQEVDQVLTDFGMPMGTFAVGDLSGLDIGWNIRREIAQAQGMTLTFATRFMGGDRYSSLSDRLVQKGRIGRKVGKGWYKYEKSGGKVATPDPEVTQIILDHCTELGIQRRSISPQEVIERTFYAAINEGFRCLEDGVAAKPEDIDVCWLLGFGFPRYQGGPMFYASQVGLRSVYDKICQFHERYPNQSIWMPCELLRRLSRLEVTPPMSEWTMKTTSKL